MRAAFIAAVLAFLPCAANAQTYPIAGPAFWAGSSATAIGLNASMRYTIANPPGSGMNCLVYGLSVFSTAATYAHFWINPTTNLPTTTHSINDVVIGASDTPACVVKADAGSAMSGGTDTGDDLPAPASAIVYPGHSVIVEPGQTLGVNIPVTVAATICVTFFWRESHQ